MSQNPRSASTGSRRGLFVLLALIALVAIAAVLWTQRGGKEETAPAPTASEQAKSGPAQPAPPKELRIGFQKSAINFVILKQSGALERRLPNTQINWVEFPAGPQQLEALSTGSIDLCYTGDTPPVFAQAAGKDLVYVGAEPPKPDTAAILVQHDSKLQNLAELKGKKIAFQKGSSSHFLVVQAIEKAGLKFEDIQPVFLTPADARAAFERGAVDAWGIWDPYYAATELAIKARALTNGQGLTSYYSYYFSSRKFADEHPDVIAAVLEELTHADQRTRDDRAGTVKFFSEFSGLDAPTVELLLKRRPPSPVNPVPAAAVIEQQQIADTFFRLGLIPKSIKIPDVIWKPVP